jgi:hypothetical protein
MERGSATQEEMTNDEIPKPEGNPNVEIRMCAGLTRAKGNWKSRCASDSSFGLRASFGLGYFVIRHSFPPLSNLGFTCGWQSPTVVYVWATR